MSEVQEGDNSCAYANDGICQDGRETVPDSIDEFGNFVQGKFSAFVVAGEGVWAHICGFLQDMYALEHCHACETPCTNQMVSPPRRSDCGPGYITSLNANSFSIAPQPPRPKPPPPNPSPPPPPLTETFNGCTDTCRFSMYCSDGGVGSLVAGHDPATGAATFQCALGSQCGVALCQPRTQDSTICSDSCRSTIAGRVKWTGESRNGVCEDGGDAASSRVGLVESQVVEIVSDPMMYGLGFEIQTGWYSTTLSAYIYHISTNLVTYDECANLCSTISTNGVDKLCHYFVWMRGPADNATQAGPKGQHCQRYDYTYSGTYWFITPPTSPLPLTYPYCSASCLQYDINEPRAVCKMYTHYNANPTTKPSPYGYDDTRTTQNSISEYHGCDQVREETLGTLGLFYEYPAVVPEVLTFRHGFITTRSGGTVPLITGEYTEYESNGRFFGVGSKLPFDPLEQGYEIRRYLGDVIHTYTFLECAELCKVYRHTTMSVDSNQKWESTNQRCKYFVSGAVQCQLNSTLPELASCDLYEDYDETLSSSSWPNGNACPADTYRHGRVNQDNFAVYPVSPGGAQYSEIAGCGFGKAQKSNSNNTNLYFDLCVCARAQAPIARIVACASTEIMASCIPIRRHLHLRAHRLPRAAAECNKSTRKRWRFFLFRLRRRHRRHRHPHQIHHPNRLRRLRRRLRFRLQTRTLPSLHVQQPLDAHKEAPNRHANHCHAAHVAPTPYAFHHWHLLHLARRHGLPWRVRHVACAHTHTQLHPST